MTNVSVHDNEEFEISCLGESSTETYASSGNKKRLMGIRVKLYPHYKAKNILSLVIFVAI